MSESVPAVSIVMPVYNVERYVGAAIDSVLSQQVPALELIIVDDGSVDGTARIVRERTQRDARVTVVTQSNSGRPSIARNRGMRAARGEIVAFLDGDDIFLPGKLDRILTVFSAHPGIDLVFHDVKRLTEAGELLAGTYLQDYKFPSGAQTCLSAAGGDVYLGTERFYNYMSAVYSPFLMSGTSVRRSRLEREEIWFREDMRCGEDVDLWFRLMRTSRAAYIDKPLAAYRYRADSTTQDKEDYYIGTNRAHVMNLARAENVLTPAERKRYVRRIADRYRHLAYLYYQRGQMQKARDSLRDSFRMRPDWRIMPLLLKTYLPQKLVQAARRWRKPC